MLGSDGGSLSHFSEHWLSRTTGKPWLRNPAVDQALSRTAAKENVLRNPWMSAWLSAANAWAGAARGFWMAEIVRQQTAMMNEMARQVVRFWQGSWMVPPAEQWTARLPAAPGYKGIRPRRGRDDNAAERGRDGSPRDRRRGGARSRTNAGAKRARRAGH